MVKSIIRYAWARGIPGLVNFAALAVFTRLLDEREYGQYTLVFAAVALGYAFLLQWLSQGVLRLAAPNAARRGTFLRTVSSLFLGLVLLTAAVLAIGIGLTAGWNSAALIAAGIGLLIAQSWQDLNLNLATADELPWRYAGLSAARAVGSFVFGGLAAWAGWGAAGVISGVALGGLVPGFWAYHKVWRPFQGDSRDPHIQQELYRYGLPLAGAFVLAYVVSGADRFFLAAIISPAAAGVYAPAYDLVLQTMATLMMVVNLGAYPRAVRAVESGDPASRDAQFRAHLSLLAMIAFPVAAGIATLAPSVSGILGPRFAPTARELLPVLALAQLLAGLKGYYLDLSFQLGRSTRLQLVTVVGAAVVNILLNIVLIPGYGVAGAAYATLVAYLVALVLSYVLGRRVLRLPIPLRSLGRIFAATAVMSLALVPVRSALGGLALAGQVALGAAVYGIVLWLSVRGDLPRLLR